jgi:hypothetical protein
MRISKKKKNWIFYGTLFAETNYRSQSFPPSPPWARECGEGASIGLIPFPITPFPIFFVSSPTPPIT